MALLSRKLDGHSALGGGRPAVTPTHFQNMQSDLHKQQNRLGLQTFALWGKRMVEPVLALRSERNVKIKPAVPKSLPGLHCFFALLSLYVLFSPLCCLSA